MQNWLKRHELYEGLDPYTHDILKAILGSRLGLGNIYIRQDDVEPVIELASETTIHIVGNRKLTVGQAFYQLSLESLESLGFLKRENITPLNNPYQSSSQAPVYRQSPMYRRAPVYRYRLTGAGDLFIRKYEKKLQHRAYEGLPTNLISRETGPDTEIRRRVYINKDIEYAHRSHWDKLPSYWVYVLPTERRRGSVFCTARGTVPKFDIIPNDTVYINLDEPIPQYPESYFLRAKVISVQKRDPVDDKWLRIGEHIFIQLGDVQHTPHEQLWL